MKSFFSFFNSRKKRILIKNMIIFLLWFALLIRNEVNKEINKNDDIDYCNNNLNEILNIFILLRDKTLIVKIIEERMSDALNAFFWFLITVIEKIDFSAFSFFSNDVFKEFV